MGLKSDAFDCLDNVWVLLEKNPSGFEVDPNTTVQRVVRTLEKNPSGFEVSCTSFERVGTHG